MIIGDYNGKNVDAIFFRKDHLNNKGTILEINWFVTRPALEQWNTQRGIPDISSTKSFLSDPFTIEKIQGFLLVMQQFIDKFNGYPTSAIKTNRAYCVFCFSFGTIEQQINLSDDLQFFYLFIDILGIKKHHLSPEYILKHELYHGISRAKENEQKVILAMQRHSEKVDHILKDHFTNIIAAIDMLSIPPVWDWWICWRAQEPPVTAISSFMPPVY